MNIICSKEKLLEGINIVLKAVPTRTTQAILECVLITAENNYIKLLANNLEMAIETSQIESEVKKAGKIALEAKIFSEVIKKLPDGNISLETNNNLTVIKSGRSKFELASQTGNDFPVLPKVLKNESYKFFSNDLKEMIKQTIFSVSQDESKPVLMGELFEIKNNKISMVALDGFRIAYKNININENYDPTEAIIPSKTLSEIAKILPSNENLDILLFLTDKHALFELSYCKIITRLIEGKFLNYANIFTENYKTLVTVNRRELAEALDRASLISIENKKHPVKLTIKNEIIIITSNTELDASYEEISAKTQGNLLEIAFNPRYLLDVLKAIASDEITMQFTSALNPCIIKPLEPEINSKYLILPLRLKDY